MLPEKYIQNEDINHFFNGENEAYFKSTFKKNNFEHSDTGWYGCINLSNKNGMINIPFANPKADTHEPNWRYLFVKCKTKLTISKL